jgi:superfamily I DNA/RNA helicase/predicted transcriptional regulator
MEIEEHKRDDSLDYLKVLRALLEIPFPVGRKLLVDFLEGEEDNKSILKNELFDLNNFGSLEDIPREKINSYIDNLVKNGMVEVITGKLNDFMTVYKITQKGREEILIPTLNKKKLKSRFNHYETRITEEEKVLFHELASFLQEFNDSQKKAIICDKKNILCIAGAGSGKTTVLTKRIEFLVNYQNIIPEKILAITFTRKARDEMKERLISLGIENVHIETFNSFCEKFLRKYETLIYNRKVRVMSYSDKVYAIRESLKRIGIEMKDAIELYFTEVQRRNKPAEKLVNLFINDCFSILDYFKIKDGKLIDFRKNLKDSRLANLVYEVCLYTQEYMNRNGLRDYTDQLLDAVDFFESHKDKVPFFEHILVDEYQDVNDIQIRLLDLLLPKNLFCVGDPRQAIFGWRGANINYILELKKKFPDCEVISLTKNYRSKKQIVDFMNESICCLGLPDLESNLNEEGELNLCSFDSTDAEFNFILGKVISSQVPKEKIFILSRTNKQLEEFSRLLIQRKIPFILKDDDSKDELEEGKITLATIHAIKGLEASIVFILGCTQQNFPCRATDHPIIEMIKSVDYDSEEEEKRVFYVAISRAKEKLYLTYSGKKHTYFINDEMKKFVKEIEY